jgi:hypothetical protein
VFISGREVPHNLCSDIVGQSLVATYTLVSALILDMLALVLHLVVVDMDLAVAR